MVTEIEGNGSGRHTEVNGIRMWSINKVGRGKNYEDEEIYKQS